MPAVAVETRRGGTRGGNRGGRPRYSPAPSRAGSRPLPSGDTPGPAQHIRGCPRRPRAGVTGAALSRPSSSRELRPGRVSLSDPTRRCSDSGQWAGNDPGATPFLGRESWAGLQQALPKPRRHREVLIALNVN